MVTRSDFHFIATSYATMAGSLVALSRISIDAANEEGGQTRLRFITRSPSQNCRLIEVGSSAMHMDLEREYLAPLANSLEVVFHAALGRTYGGLSA